MSRNYLEIKLLVAAVTGLVAFTLNVLLYGLFLLGKICDPDDSF